MACCAFAAFLLVQLLAPVSGPIAALRRRLFGTRAPAAAWRPGAATDAASTPTPRHRVPWRAVLATAVVLEVTLAGLWLGSTPATAGPIDYDALALAHDAWCRAFEATAP